jgi:NAD+ kinase
MCTALDLEDRVPQILHGEKDDNLSLRTRIRCKVKSTFAETRLVPALNDLLIANPIPAAVSRFRLGWLSQIDGDAKDHEGTLTRFAGIPYGVSQSLNVWSSGMWVSTSTGSSAAMAAAGGQAMDMGSSDIQYLIRYVPTVDDICFIWCSYRHVIFYSVSLTLHMLYINVCTYPFTESI